MYWQWQFIFLVKNLLIIRVADLNKHITINIKGIVHPKMICK